MMEPTQSKPGHRDAQLPVPMAPAQPEAYQRAPTLMAGEAAGLQGEVRVWSPNVPALRRQAWTLGLGLFGFFALFISLGIAFRFNIGGMFGGMALPIMILAATVAAVRRPCYLTTDDQGIGVTTSRSSRALRWDEIQSLVLGCGTIQSWRLVLGSGEPIDLNLTGYTKPTLDELRQVITARACLERHPTKQLHYVRTPASLPGASGTASLPPPTLPQR